MQTQLDVEVVETKRIPTRAAKHTVTEVRVAGLEDLAPGELPDIPVDAGHFAVGRIIHVMPQPGPGVVNIWWDGDTNEPAFSLDMWFGDEATFYVHAWGG